jgi:hypothetical protein
MTSVLRIVLCFGLPRPQLALVLGAVTGLALGGCGTVAKVTGSSKEGATSEKEARFVQPDDPLARPIQVAWTSARAQHCGFMFDPTRLKTDYLSDELRRGAPPDQIQRLTRAYDYTYESVKDTISEDPNYCNKERLDAIRKDLRRYLAGDYAPAARLAR